MARSPAGRRHEDSRRDDRHRSSSRNARRYDPRDTRDHRESHHGRDRDYQRDRRDRGEDERYYSTSRYARDDRRSAYRADDTPRNGYGARDGGRKRSRDRGSSPVRYDRRRHDHSDAGNRGSKRIRRESYSSNEKTSRPGTAMSAAEKKAAEEQRAAEEAKFKQQERLAKVEAWKQKNMVDKTANTASPANHSPAASSPAVTGDDGLGSTPAEAEDGPPSPPRAPFDPRQIKANVLARMQNKKKKLLDQDNSISVTPVSTSGNVTQHSRTINSTTSSLIRTKSRELTRPANAAALKAGGAVTGDAKISGFGLNKSIDDKGAEKSPTNTGSAALDEDEDVARKPRRLPDLLHSDPDIHDGGANNDHDAQDEEGDDLRSDEEEAEAAREAAQQRAEALQAPPADASTTDAAKVQETSNVGVQASKFVDKMEVEAEVDSLDAFMDNLAQRAMRKPKPISQIKRNGSAAQMFGEDEGPDLDARGGGDPEELLRNPKKKKKEMADVDHSKINYEEFRKSFYTESPELAQMSEEDLQQVRYDLDGIKCHGIDIPKPITKWEQGGFGTQILDVIRLQKFEKPTAIQAQALPAIMSGRDTIGIAKTGSGKTLAFLLPMFRHLKDQRPLANLDGPIGLILAPTRELASQIHNECKPYLTALNLRAVATYGGIGIKDQIAELKRGAEIIVCTPGRIIDLLAANGGRVTNLRRVTYLVIDEADRMFDMGFGPQIMKVLNNIRPDRQAVFFSATFPPKVEAVARQALHQPVEILAGGRVAVANEITQVVEIRPQNTKFKRLLQLLGDHMSNDEDARVLIFVERQEAADLLFKELNKSGYPAASVHGGREQVDREEAMANFKKGHIPIMIATSVAARGLDVKQLKLVINFDAPSHSEDYVHRAGRTGRAGNTGTAITFVTPEEDRFAPYLIRALKDSKQTVPDELRELAKTFQDKVASGATKVHGSGFGGKGIEHLEVARAAERAWTKRQFRTDDEVAAEDGDEESKKKKAEKEKVEKLVAKATNAVQDRATASVPSTAAVIPSSLADRLNDFAKVQKKELPPPEEKVDRQTLMDRVRAAAANIEGRVGANKGTGRIGGPPDNRGPDAGAYHSTIEINEFPQQARWAVTNRTNVAKILEATGTSITSKGIYYPPGKEPEGPDAERKLYILVEGDTEVVVAQAATEISRHLTEGTLKAMETETRPATGRYSVL